mgnify:FL=1|tara:strand:+ start:7122 stop:7376 length:255 start_codon:yes stop_codon:yes gene_type:complete
MTHIVESFLAKTTRNEVTKTKGYKGCGLEKKADKNIKYCKKCNRCWEPICKPNNSKKQFLWYDDFPAYKKGKKTCPTCLNNTNN